MKKNLKNILIFLNLIMSLIFCFVYLSFNSSFWNLTFLISICFSLITQFFCLQNFKFGKRLLFILLGIALTLVSSLLIFLIPGYLSPYSIETNISFFASWLGFFLVFVNFTIFYTYIMVFVDKLKEKEKNKSSFVKLLVLYPLIVTIFETLLMFSFNKA